MSAPVYGTVEYIDRLTALIVAEYAGAGDSASIHLYQNDIEPDANQTVDTFVEADFAGYGSVELEMSAPSMNDQNMVVTKSNLIDFTSAAGVDPQTIYGVFIKSQDGLKVRAAQRFDTPQTMGGALPQAISGVWRMSEPLTTLGWIDVEN